MHISVHYLINKQYLQKICSKMIQYRIGQVEEKIKTKIINKPAVGQIKEQVKVTVECKEEMSEKGSVDWHIHTTL